MIVLLTVVQDSLSLSLTQCSENCSLTNTFIYLKTLAECSLKREIYLERGGEVEHINSN